MSDSGFNNDIYLFNGHGEDLTEENEFSKFKLPDNVIYITITKCGTSANLASVDVLKSYRWRNKVFDIVPQVNTPGYFEYKKELGQIFGMYDPEGEHKGLSDEEIKKLLEDIHVKFPGEEIINNEFTPISTIGNPKTNYKGLKLDGASGLMKRDDWITLERELVPLLTERVLAKNLTPDQFLNYYKASSYPTKDEVEAKLKENNNDVKKTILYFFEEGRIHTKDLINRFKSSDDKRKTIFINPLCRVIDPESEVTPEEVALQQSSSSDVEGRKYKEPGGTGGRRRKTRRHNKKLKRQTRKRR